MGTLVLAGATSGSATLTPVDAVTAVITLPSATATLATLGANAFVGNQTISGTLTGGATLFSPITNSLSGDVALNNTALYFDGPSVAQGTVGTWFVSGNVSVQDNAGAANINVKLWDGTTIIDSGKARVTTINGQIFISLSGFITSPAGNLRISCRDGSSTSGLIEYNASGLGKDSTITAIRIG